MLQILLPQVVDIVSLLHVYFHSCCGNVFSVFMLASHIDVCRELPKPWHRKDNKCNSITIIESIVLYEVLH